MGSEMCIRDSFNAVQTALDGLAEELGVQIIIQREDLFQFMYKI